jgi:hypothetical protein
MTISFYSILVIHNHLNHTRINSNDTHNSYLMQIRSTSKSTCQIGLAIILLQHISVSDFAEIRMVPWKRTNGQDSLLCHDRCTFLAFRGRLGPQSVIFLFLGFISDLFNYVSNWILFLFYYRINLLYKDIFRLVSSSF